MKKVEFIMIKLWHPCFPPFFACLFPQVCSVKCMHGWDGFERGKVRVRMGIRIEILVAGDGWMDGWWRKLIYFRDWRWKCLPANPSNYLSIGRFPSISSIPSLLPWQKGCLLGFGLEPNLIAIFTCLAHSYPLRGLYSCSWKHPHVLVQ